VRGEKQDLERTKVSAEETSALDSGHEKVGLNKERLRILVGPMHRDFRNDDGEIGSHSLTRRQVR